MSTIEIAFWILAAMMPRYEPPYRPLAEFMLNTTDCRPYEWQINIVGNDPIQLDPTYLKAVPRKLPKECETLNN